MNASKLTARADVAVYGVAHLVRKDDFSLAEADDVRPYLNDRTGQQLAFVGDVLLHCQGPVARLAQVGGRDPDRGQQVPSPFVEFADVPHDVHVSHVVALPGIDYAAIRQK